MVISLKFKFLKYYKNKFVYLFSFFYFYLLLRGVTSEYPYDSLIKYNGPIFYFRYLFFVLGIKFLLDCSPKIIKKFCITLLIVIIFSSMDGYFQWIFGFNFFGFQSPSIKLQGYLETKKYLVILAHVIAAFNFLARIFLVLIKKNNFVSICLVLSEIMIFISNDRAGFLKIFQFTLLLIFLIIF